MKQFLLLIISSLLFAVPAHAQAWDDDGEADNRLNRSDSLKMSRVKYIKLNLGLKNGRSKNTGATVQFYKAGEPTAAVTVRDGKASFKLDINSEYLIKVSYPDHVTKIISFNTTVPRENILDLWPQFKFKVELVEGNTTKGTLKKPYVRIKWASDLYDFEPGVYNKDDIPPEELEQMLDQMVQEYEEEQQEIANQEEAEQLAAAASAAAKEKAEEELAAKEEAKILQAEEEFRKQAEKTALDNQLQVIIEKIAKENTKLASLKSEMSNLETEVDCLRVVLESAKKITAEDKLAILENEKSVLDKQITMLEKEQQFVTAEKTNAIASINKASLENQKASLETIINGTSAEEPFNLNELNSNIAIIDLKSDSMENALVEARQKVSAKQEEIIAAKSSEAAAAAVAQNNRAGELRSQISEIKAREATLGAVLDQLRSEEGALIATIQNLNANYATLNESFPDDPNSVLLQYKVDKLLIDEDIQKQNKLINKNRQDQAAKEEEIILEILSRLNIELELNEGTDKITVQDLIAEKSALLDEVRPKVGQLSGEIDKIDGQINSIASDLQQTKIDLSKAKALERQTADAETAAAEQERIAKQERLIAESEALRLEQEQALQDQLNIVQRQIDDKNNALIAAETEIARLNNSIIQHDLRINDKTQIQSNVEVELNGLVSIDSINKAIALNRVNADIKKIEKAQQADRLLLNVKLIAKHQLTLEKLELEQSLKESAEGKASFDNEILIVTAAKDTESAQTAGLKAKQDEIVNEIIELETEASNLNDLLVNSQTALANEQEADAAAEQLRQEALLAEQQRKESVLAEIDQLETGQNVFIANSDANTSEISGLQAELSAATEIKYTNQTNLEGSEGLDLLKLKTPFIESEIKQFTAKKILKGKELEQVANQLKSNDLGIEILNKRLSIASNEEKPTLQNELLALKEEKTSLVSYQSSLNAEISSLSAEVKKKQSALLANNSAISAEIKRLEGEADAERIRQAAAAELDRLAQEKAKQETERIALEKKAQLNQELSNKNDEISTLEQSIISLESKDNSLLAKAKTLEQKVEQLRENASADGDELLAIKQQLDLINAEVNELKNHLELEGLKKQLWDKKMQKNEIEQEVAIINEQLKDVDAVIDETEITTALQTTYNVFKDNYNAAQSSLSSLKAQLASKENERTEQSNLLASTKSRIENEAKVARQAEEDRIKKEIAQKKTKEASIGTEITALNDQKTLFQSEIDVLKEEINNYNNQLSSLSGAKKVTRAEQIATKEVAVAYKTIERLAVEKNTAAKQIAQAQVKLARLELQNRLTKDQASSISSIKAKIQALKSKEKSLKQKYEEWLAKKKAREATLMQKTAAAKTALAEAKRAAGIKEQRLKEEAIAKQEEEKAAKAAAARVQSENAEKANTRINSQLQKAQEIVELRDVNYADGKNKVNKTFVKTREEDDVYEKKVNFRTKAVLYFKNGAPVTKENYESELGAKRAAWKATNN